MRFVIVGADSEENLGVGYVAASALRAGHEVAVVPLVDRSQLAGVAERVLAQQPTVVGLAIQFQHWVGSFIELAQLLRQSGFAGHLTCGGHPASLAWPELLAAAPAIDSVVLFDGEDTVVDLLAALAAAAPLSTVDGLAYRDRSGVPQSTGHRPLNFLLDTHPEPLRYRAHTHLLGVPLIPVLWTRGCWGSCAFCSVTSFYREAREHHRGGVYRQRSVEGLADEMARLYHAAGGAIFFFHDDTFLLPRSEDSQARLYALRAALDERGVGGIGICAKVRPDALTPELAHELRALGAIRLILGVENASDSGLSHLQHRMTVVSISQALDACRDADIFADYHLQLFEPGTRLADVAENLAFMRRHARHPVQVDRAEPYVGTPLHQALLQSGQMQGDLCTWGYRLADQRTELLRRIAAAAMRQRTSTAGGLDARCGALGFAAKTLKHLVVGEASAALDREAAALCERIVVNCVDHLQAALDFCAGVDLCDRSAISDFTTALGLQVAVDDARLGGEIETLQQQVEAIARAHGDRMQRALVGSDDPERVQRAQAFVHESGSAIVLDLERRAGSAAVLADNVAVARPGVDPCDLRTADLPLHAPPAVAIALEPTADGIEVQVPGASADCEVRFEISGGAIAAAGASALWRGARPGDQVRVAVRSASGVAIAHCTVRG